VGNEADILYFDPFYFKNGNASKPKYCIVLKSSGEKSILASLPSSLNFCPADNAEKKGCIEVPEACFNCFVFKGKTPVATNGWSFPLDTYLYGQQIDEYEVAILKDIYPVEGLDYRIIGTLQSILFQDLKNCFINSANVKRKFRRLLSS
jgi:hypothetical protein